MGDAGFVWGYGPDAIGEEKWWREWISNKPWTTFCVLGNHENYDMIEQLPTTTFGGEEVYQVSKSVFYAKTGRIYDLCGKKCLVINGADSRDKEWRTPHISWWEQEQITDDEVRFAKENLKKVGNSVDFVFSHTGGTNVCNYLGFKATPSDERLQQVLDTTIYQKHFCSHYHEDMVTPTTRILYDDIIMIGADVDNIHVF
jgi:hypothetical protein